MAKSPRKRTPADTDEQEQTRLEIPLPEKDELGSEEYFLQEIQAAEDRIKDEIAEWKLDLKRYAGQKAALSGVRTADTINVNVQFYTVEQKKPQLAFQTPFVQLEAKRDDEALRSAAPVAQAVTNQILSRSGVDAETLLDEVLSDILITSAFGATKIGYEVVTVPVTVPTGRMVPSPDPNDLVPDIVDPVQMTPRLDAAGQPVMVPRMVPATNPDGTPETVEVPKKIWSQYYWRRFSPADIRLPAGFTSQRYDEAPWIAWRFPLGEVDAKDRDRRFGAGGGGDESLSLLSDKDRRALDRAGYGYEVWYRASLYDSTVKNPDLIRQLVIVPPSGRSRGKSRVLEHRNSPYQRFDEHGKLIEGMRGYPVHIFTIRNMPDSAYPQSDCRVLRSVADEKTMGRSLMVKQRKRNLSMRAVNTKMIDKDNLKRLERGDVQEIIPINGPVDGAIAAVDKSTFPPENFEFDRIAQNDIDRLAASGANQQGLQTENVGSATEATLIQRATDTRLAKERNRFLNCYLAGVEKLFALVQMMTDEADIVEIEGEAGASRYRQWDKQTIQGHFAFSLKPDSAQRINAAEDRAEFLKLFNLVVNFEGANRDELFKVLIGKWGQDPAKMITPADQRPKPEPEKPKLSINIKGEDLNPLSMQYANVKALLEANGVLNLAPAQGQTAAAAPPPLKAGEPLPPANQHHAEQTGRISGPGPDVQAVGRPN